MLSPGKFPVPGIDNGGQPAERLAELLGIALPSPDQPFSPIFNALQKIVSGLENRLRDPLIDGFPTVLFDDSACIESPNTGPGRGHDNAARTYKIYGDRIVCRRGRISRCNPDCP